MTLYVWRYYISYGNLKEFVEEGYKETEKLFLRKGNRLYKKEEGKPEIKSRTNYPYVDVWFTEKKTRKEVIDIIIRFLKEKWGLWEKIEAE